jgi:hypothetical protein
MKLILILGGAQTVPAQPVKSSMAEVPPNQPPVKKS